MVEFTILAHWGNNIQPKVVKGAVRDVTTDNGCAQSEISSLVEQIRQVAALVGDPVGDLARTIQGMIEGDADPYLLAGVLVEGAVQAVIRRIPEERRTAVGAALLQLMVDRLRAGTGDNLRPN